jgi:outer membrane protein TolC
VKVSINKPLGLVLFGVILFSGCRSNDYYKKLRAKKADEHFKKIAERKFPEGQTFSLPLCIETALKNNFDLKVFQLKEQISKERRTAALLGMLPELNVTNDLTSRTNEPGASSQSLSTGDQSLVSSKSTEKTVNSTKVELVFSVLDFGLAYFNSVQAEDRVQLTNEQLRRAAQNLILDVTKAYFRVAATQYAVETTEKLLAMCDDIDSILMDLTRDKTISPLRALDERKRFINIRKRLMEYRRSYENSCVELKSLMGYHPIDLIKVNTKCLDKIRIIDLPNIDLLERIALRERPELYQLDMQQHITIVEARKAILMMFPNVRMFVDFTNSSNKFLYNHSWWEIGVRAAYNLFKLPAQIQQYMALDKEIDEVDTKTLSMTVAVMAQVRIAHANMMEVKDRYQLDKRIYDAYTAHLETAKKNAGALGNISPIEIKRLELETAETAIDRAHSLGNYYLSYYRLLNSIGVEAMEEKQLKEIVKKLEEQAQKELEAEKAQDTPEQFKEEEERMIRTDEKAVKAEEKAVKEDQTVIPKQSDIIPAKVKDTYDKKIKEDTDKDLKKLQDKEKKLEKEDKKIEER